MGYIEAYGAGAPLLGVRRSVFLVDSEGIVRYRHVALVGVSFRRSRDPARALAAMP